jgi:hypothetical protein
MYKPSVSKVGRIRIVVYSVHLLVYLVEIGTPEGQNLAQSRIAKVDNSRPSWTCMDL